MGCIMSEHTSVKVVDHCDRLRWGSCLGFTVEDTNMFKITEACGLCLLVPGLMYFKIWLLRLHEDVVILVDFQLNLDRAALSIDARNGKVIDVVDLCCGDHGQVDHSICRTKQSCYSQYRFGLLFKTTGLHRFWDRIHWVMKILQIFLFRKGNG